LSPSSSQDGGSSVTASSTERPGFGQWLIFLLMALWLALVPPAVVATLSALSKTPPAPLVQSGLIAPGNPLLPSWAFGLLATGLTLGLHLLAFVPLYLATRKPQRTFLHTTAVLLMAIALVQTLNALAALPWAGQEPVPPYIGRTLTTVLRLALVLPFLLLGLGWIEARRRGDSLRQAWRRVGWRLWLNPSALWLALASGAAIVWPWVLVGSLGSVGTTAANTLQALTNSLNEETLFRGFAFAWLWRAMTASPEPSPQTGGRTRAAVASLLLFAAAQGGTVLPLGDWGATLRVGTALLLGLLLTELTVRAGGSIWPAVLVHFLYDWFHFAFVDPRSEEEILHWLAQTWAPLVAGGIGFLLWLGRKVAESASRPRPSERRPRAGAVAAVALATVLWLGVAVSYLTLGVPGFQPDGFLIFMDEQADLSPAAAIADPVERRVWVYHTLVETADRTQAPLRADLDRRGIAYRSHYLINMIEVQERPGLHRAFAKEPGVASVLFQPGMRRYPVSFRLPDMGHTGPNGPEWNVREVGADQVWKLGYTGQGVIVGNADTGVTWDHPALKKAYMGWDGTSADHDYHWYDAWDGLAEPWDDNGHGTHTTGIVVGLDGENQVGLAPGARWIACRNMRYGIGNPGAYMSCMEFLLAPFPIGGDPLRDGAPAKGAQVVNNSWGCPAREGCQPDTLRLAVENLREAGQMMVVSAGNDGPACGTVKDPPALYDSVISVGATDNADRAASFSSRGPVTIDASQRRKPDLVAPGVNIRSSVPGGYASLPGTSMSGPHVAGVVALMWSADPSLVGDLARTETILTETAKHLQVDAVCTTQSNLTTVCACGGDAPQGVPNNVYGWGEVNALAAVQALLSK
jgi:subtilisin family serine protease